MFRHRWLRRLSNFTFLFSLAATACHRLKTENVAQPTPIRADGQALTSQGENFEPSFSPDGQKIVYVSIRGDHHSQGQIYEMELRSHQERRITFQNAVAHNPKFSPKGDALIYSSATDELEENPPLLQTKSQTHFIGPAEYLEPSEIYYHQLRDLQRTRLTKHAGYDGQASFLSATELVFTRQVDNGLALMQKSLHAKSAHAWRGAGPRAAQLAVAPGGKHFAWIEYSEDFKTSHLLVKDGNQTRTILDDLKVLKKDPVWTPDGESILLTVVDPDQKHSEIYRVHADGSCPSPLTSDHVRSEQPAVSPTGDAFAFVADPFGARQVYLKPLPKSPTCAPDANKAKVETKASPPGGNGE